MLRLLTSLIVFGAATAVGVSTAQVVSTLNNGLFDEESRRAHSPPDGATPKADLSVMFASSSVADARTLVMRNITDATITVNHFCKDVLNLAARCNTVDSVPIVIEPNQSVTFHSTDSPAQESIDDRRVAEMIGYVIDGRVFLYPKPGVRRPATSRVDG